MSSPRFSNFRSNELLVSLNQKTISPLFCVFLFLVSLLALVSCGSKKLEKDRDKGVPYYVDVEKYVDNIRPVMLSEIGSSLEYIPLETRPDLMIGSLSAVALYQDYLIIKDDQQIYLFDANGNFIRKIGAYGRGPGEYTFSKFYIDKYNNHIYVLTSDKISCFDFEGTLVNTIGLDKTFMNFIIIDDEKIMLNNTRAQMAPVDDEPVYNWSIIDHDGNEITKMGQAPKITKNPPFFTTIISLYMFNGKANYMVPFTDTLFYLDGNDEKVYATFNLGKRKLNLQEMTSTDVVKDGQIVDDRSLIYIAKVDEDPDFLYVQLGFGFNWIQPCIFDKKSQELTLIENDWFVNDIDGGLTFWPEYIREDNTLVAYKDAITIVNHINEMEPFEKPGSYKGKGIQLEELKDIIDENSNPVIILCKRE